MIIVAGTVRAPVGSVAALKPAMAEMIAATRTEEGCVEYSFAEDAVDEGLIRIFEIWRDEAALTGHFASPHMARWRAATAAHAIADRRISLYEVAGSRAL